MYSSTHPVRIYQKQFDKHKDKEGKTQFDHLVPLPYPGNLPTFPTQFKVGPRKTTPPKNSADISRVVFLMGKHPKVDYLVVDAFSDSAFKGNPAAVCFLEEERDDAWLQAVATEFNISQTCFLTEAAKEGSDAVAGCPRFRLRWFTPVAEVKLCGHATLAAVHALFTSRGVDSDSIEFLTLSGILTAKKVPDSDGSTYLIELDFPIVPSEECNSEDISSSCDVFGNAPVVEMRKTAVDDLLVVFSSTKLVEEFLPQLDKIMKWRGRGVIITAAAAPDSEFDFVSRFFCPKLGINEDPVCGSAHCALAPYWSKKLGKHDFMAYQASPRSGILKLHVDESGGRVKLSGKAVTVMQGSILT